MKIAVTYENGQIITAKVIPAATTVADITVTKQKLFQKNRNTGRTNCSPCVLYFHHPSALLITAPFSAFYKIQLQFLFFVL